MTVTVTHSTPADGTFSVDGATAWDANHTLSGLGTMAEQNANNVAITGGTITGVTLGSYVPYTGATTAIDLNAQTVTNIAHLGLNSTVVPDILFRAYGDNNSTSRIAIRGYSSNASSSSIRIAKFRGTYAAPQAPQSGDSLGKFELAGYGTTSSSGYPQASYEGVATENWGAIARGAKALFYVTPNTTITQAVALTIDQDKSATFAGAISVTGHTTFEGVTSTGATGTGKLVYDTSPTLITPALGTPSALVGTNITGTASGLSIGGNAATATNATTVTNGVYTTGSYSNPSWLPSVALTTGTISTAPSSSTDIVNKSYADSIASGVNFHAACQYATAAALAANTYNNGTSGVGATLTATSNGALVIDGHTFTTPDIGVRVLIKDEVTQANNGVYTVTAVGGVSAVYVLTRATDYDSSGSGTNEVDQGDLLLVINGTVNANTSWVQQTPLPITIGTTALVFLQFAAIQTYTAGTGLTLTTNQFSITNTGTAGTYGSASLIPVITTNAQGQVTGVTTAANPQGTVTSVGFTGGLLSIATATTTPAITVAGTSGGVPYFSSGTTWATSAALAANAIVVGGGAGVAPATVTTGTNVLTALGVAVGSAGAVVVNGGVLGTPSSGTVTNLTGTASININGTVGATTPAAGTFAALSATSNAVGSVNAKAGGLTAVTAVAGSLTLATGGVTIATQVMAATATWRIVAYGTYVASSSATVRQLTMRCYWGATALTAVTTGNVLASTVQTTPWRVELEITGSSATAAWCTAVLSAQVTSATIPLNYVATAASVTGLTTTSTLDFRVGQAGTAVAGDTINVHSVTLERIV